MFKTTYNRILPFLKYLMMLSLVLATLSCDKRADFKSTDLKPPVPATPNQAQPPPPVDPPPVDPPPVDPPPVDPPPVDPPPVDPPPVDPPPVDPPPVDPPPVDPEAQLDSNCVQVYYDRSSDSTFTLGRTYALMLVNLLGHFPLHQPVIGPVELYRKGDIQRCHATFYLGSYFNNVLPDDFLADWKSATKRVVWIGYNFWQLGTDFEAEFGYRDYSLTMLDESNRTAGNKPSFFRDVLYKGETFSKYNEFSGSNFVTSWEQMRLSNRVSNVSNVLASARHSFTNEVIPWAIQAGNRFYVAEQPFSYIHEGDRYFVFADLMFDFLNAPARHNSKNALLRIEDIHPLVSLERLDEAVEILKANSVIPHIMLVPIFNDPLFAIEGHGTVPMIRMEEKLDFVALIQRYKSEGSVFIWHGVQHQYSNIKNPFTGASGDDYEFWNSVTTSPIAEDSPSYVLDVLDDGFRTLSQMGIAPKFWVTPHYNGSPLDNIIFGKVFPWLISRGVYADYSISGQVDSNGANLYYTLDNNAQHAQNRRAFLSALQVTMKGNQFGQLFPYELYGDIFFQKVIPENLGNVQPYLSDQVVATRNVDRILADARRNLVLRDVWASVFYHPFLLDPELNSENADASRPKDLHRLVAGLKNLGYRFINMETYAAGNSQPPGKPRLELEAIR